MKTVSMSGSLRENVGKKDAKKHRREGNVPCVLYGGEEQFHFAMPERSFKDIIFTPNSFIIELNIGSKKYNAILKDVQYHPVSDHILHVDFMQIFDDKPVAIAVPIRITGTSKGVLKGGKLIRKYRKLLIKALPKYLPDEIVVDITKLNINESRKVMEMKLDNIEFLDPPTSIIVSVKSARAVVGDEEEEAHEEGGAAEAASE
ncbi:MAG: 50S ribosomal protein L25/general stress protein Ctc [Bacteroidales bacterium]|nr:50S ribosomal protein L25/general stress protein Ctc [Bacteroidales bacterium]